MSSVRGAFGNERASPNVVLDSLDGVHQSEGPRGHPEPANGVEERRLTRKPVRGGLVQGRYLDAD